MTLRGGGLPSIPSVQKEKEVNIALVSFGGHIARERGRRGRNKKNHCISSWRENLREKFYRIERKEPFI